VVSEKTSRRAAESHAGQMTAASDKLNVHLKDNAGLTFDERLRSGAGRASRPVGARLEAWRAASRSAIKVDFVGRGAIHGHVRPMLVVPVEE